LPLFPQALTAPAIQAACRHRPPQRAAATNRRAVAIRGPVPARALRLSQRGLSQRVHQVPLDLPGQGEASPAKGSKSGALPPREGSYISPAYLFAAAAI